jgi:hypothetical protein
VSLPLPIGTVVRLTDQRPPTKVPATTDPDTGRKKAAHTLPYAYNRCVVSGYLDLGEGGLEAVLTPLDGHAEPLVIDPDVLLTRTGYELDDTSTREHAEATRAAAEPAAPGGTPPPWETDPATLTETAA